MLYRLAFFEAGYGTRWEIEIPVEELRKTGEVRAARAARRAFEVVRIAIDCKSSDSWF